MKKYKYQMHTHTTPTSKCSAMAPEALISAIVSAGYSGCVLTNHFLHGNTGISRELAWDDFVREYENNYLECKRCAKEYDVDVLFGIEEHIGDGKEILCYGLTPKMLYDHPELSEIGGEIWYKTLHALGCIVIQAHPYREVHYIKDPGPLPLDIIDGIEVYNYSNADAFNERAAAFAAKNPSLILTSGADAHAAFSVGFGGIEVNERITDERALCELLKSGEYTLITP
jgi:predicted metal-dependent phosphoesterase TrpH